MHQLVGVLREFGVIELFEFVDGEFEGVNLSFQLGHKLLWISRFSKLEYFIVVFDPFLLLLDLLLLLDVSA